MAHIEQIPAELTWQIRHKAMYPDRELEDVKLADDENGIHFGLFDQNKLISVGSWFRRNENEAQFRKVATLEEFRNLGYGTLLMKYIIGFNENEKVKILWCNARVTALRFYQNLGFTEKGRTFAKDEIDYVIMQLKFE